jgi:hypothetical protein
VRGQIIDYSPAAINRLLGARVPPQCAYKAMKAEIDGWDEPTRRIVKEYVALPGTEWYQGAGGNKPTKIQANHFKPVPRVWFEFFIRNIIVVSNTSEAQVAIVAGVKLIMEGKNINLGQLICDSIVSLKKNTKQSFNLINALCKDQGVSTPPLDDEFCLPLGAMRKRELRRFSLPPIGYQPPREGEESDEDVNRQENDEDVHQEESDEDLNHNDQFPEQPQAPDVATSSCSASELATLLHMMDVDYSLTSAPVCRRVIIHILRVE